MAPRKLGAKKSNTATLKVLPPVSSLEASIPEHVKRRASKIHIHPGLEREDDGVLYRPGNGTEGELWEDDWCSKCEHDSHEDKVCPIHKVGLLGQAPEEWLWFDGKPVCKGFEYTQATLDEDWKNHLSQVAYGTTTVDYEPMQFTGEVNELVVNSMMSHWCHSCHKKDSCAGYSDLVKDKGNLPDYWIWLKKFPLCSKFQAKQAIVQSAKQGTLIQPAIFYRGYNYWIEMIPGSSLYAGFYQLVNAKSVERLDNDQVSVVMAAMMLRDAIDKASGNENPGNWVEKYCKQFVALDKSVKKKRS